MVENNEKCLKITKKVLFSSRDSCEAHVRTLLEIDEKCVKSQLFKGTCKFLKQKNLWHLNAGSSFYLKMMKNDENQCFLTCL